MAYRENEGANRGAGSPVDRKAKGRNSGEFDFGGQEQRDDSAATDTQEKEAREAHGLEHANHGVHFSHQHNEHNGAGKGTRVLKSDSAELHGGRVNQREGGVP